MSGKLNIALIGAGRIGRVHAGNLAYRIPEVNLAAVSDVVEDAASSLAADFDVAMTTTDYGELLADDRIDAVAICSSTDTHARIIIEAAGAGKHIFCEKPIDFELGRIDEALAVVEAAGVKLQVGFNRRFDPNFQRARDLVAAGRVGTPHLVRVTSRDPEPPPLDYVRVSGGIFADMTIHDFDMARFLIADEIVEVYAAGAVLVDKAIGEAGDIDTAMVTLRYRGGAIGTIDNSRKAVYGYDQRVEVFGSGGGIVVSNDHPNTAVCSDARSVSRDLPLYFFLERYEASYLGEMRAFAGAVLADTPPLVTGTDGRIPVVMAKAAALSCKENRPVRLDEIEG